MPRVMPPLRLPPGHPTLVYGPGGPLADAVVRAFAEAGGRPVFVAPTDAPDGLRRAWAAAEQAVGTPRTVVWVPDNGADGAAALARLAGERGAKALVLVVSTCGAPDPRGPSPTAWPVPPCAFTPSS